MIRPRKSPRPQREPGAGDRQKLSPADTVGHTGQTMLITGGAGFIGCNLAVALAQQGHRVLLLDSLARAGAQNNAHWLLDTYPHHVELITADVRSADDVRHAVAQADQVFHLAAQVSVTQSLRDPVMDFDVNAHGTLNVLEAARRMTTPPPVLFTSTSKAYGNLAHINVRRNGERYEPIDDFTHHHGLAENRLDCHTPHACSKGAADQYALDYATIFGLRTVVFRLGSVYGPQQFGDEDHGWVSHFLNCAVEEKPITIFGDGCQARDLLFVTDLVNAMLLAMQNIQSTAGRAFNIGGGPGNVLSLLEVIDLISETVGKHPQVNFRDWRPSDQRYYASDTTAFRNATGWQPEIDPKIGLARTYDWLKTWPTLPASSSHYAPANAQPRRTFPDARDT